ncbi:MAG: hypothetical protein IT289_13415 [Oligoflexia bacterium]|nr:hypothetical protein [Oligoflexia bacterium]
MKTNSSELNSVGNTVVELSNRWKRARVSAIREIGDGREENEFLAILETLSIDSFEKLLKIVFFNSRKLGNSYQKSIGLTWERSDFVLYLSQLGSPCLSGSWSGSAKADSLKRKGCSSGVCHGQRYCQYWREAVDGLVLGLSVDVGFARHASVNAGDSFCEDVIYQDEASLSDAIWENRSRWGSLPNNMRDDLDSITQKLSRQNIDLRFLGVAEGNLFYKLEPKKNLTCGSAGALYRSQIEFMVKQKFPQIKLRDASPVAVYGEKA